MVLWYQMPGTAGTSTCCWVHCCWCLCTTKERIVEFSYILDARIYRICSRVRRGEGRGDLRTSNSLFLLGVGQPKTSFGVLASRLLHLLLFIRGWVAFPLACLSLNYCIVLSCTTPPLQIINVCTLNIQSKWFLYLET